MALDISVELTKACELTLARHFSNHHLFGVGSKVVKTFALVRLRYEFKS